MYNCKRISNHNWRKKIGMTLTMLTSIDFADIWREKGSMMATLKVLLLKSLL